MMKALQQPILLFCVFCLFLFSGGLAQEVTDTQGNEENGLVYRGELSTPRSTMKTFLSNMNAALQGEPDRWRSAAVALNLADVPSLEYDAAAREAALRLYEVFNRIEKVDIDSIPENVTGDLYVYKDLPSGRIAMSRLVVDGKSQWLFTQNTVDQTLAMYMDVKDNERVIGLPDAPTFATSPNLWFRTNLPRWLFKRTFILENFQWIGLFGIILLGFILDRLSRALLSRAISHQMQRKDHSFDSEHLDSLVKWSGLCLAGIIWLLGIRWLGLSDQVTLILRLAAVFFSCLAGGLALFRITDFVAFTFEKKAEQTDNKFDDVLVPLLRKTTKIFITAFGFIFLADNLDINISSLLAGLGIGGLAFALAAKDTVENLFGSLTVLIDRPFNIGDWINIEGLDGTVEQIGLRSTRLRTFYNSLVTIPNSNLIKAKVDNYGQRRYRRIKTMITVTYNTPPEKIDAFCEGIRELVRQHPYTRKDYYHVWLNQFGAHSLDILVYCFVETPDWATELREKHRLYLDIIRLAKRLGIEFAFPTQTLYIERGQGAAKADPAPFSTPGKISQSYNETRQDVHELVNQLYKTEAQTWPPPPVDFTQFEDQQMEDIPRKNRGGDSGE